MQRQIWRLIIALEDDIEVSGCVDAKGWDALYGTDLSTIRKIYAKTI